VFAASAERMQPHAIDYNTEYFLMSVTVVGAAIAIFWATTRYRRKPEMHEATGFGKILANKWYVDECYNFIIVKPLNWLARFLNSFIERRFIDGIVNGMGKLVTYSSRQVRLLQSGQVGSYVLLMVLSI